ncbi:MAG: translational GTPase TypA [Synergistales bacterium]|nr:translational GTPase TypA [Synergistales bacterium]
MHDPKRIRNLAIVAHIDHGKTTLIDSIFKATKVFHERATVEERVMDSNELERERGITIRSKHCTVEWKDYLINLIDTPGHADFSGEVERILSTVDSVLILVDAIEGAMPQTRYVLHQALRLGLHPIVFINKADRPQADPDRALDDTFDLFIELGATDEQADFPFIYGSGLQGWAVHDLAAEERDSMDPLFETIISHVPAPAVFPEEPFLMQVSTMAWSEYTGRIGCGKVLQGTLRKGDAFRRASVRWNTPEREEGNWEVVGEETERAAQLWVTRGLSRVEVNQVEAGDIVWIAGAGDIHLGDTFSAPALERPALPPIAIEEPTVSMFFLVNNGPFAGREGQAITLRQLKARLEREQQANVSLHVEDLGRHDGMKVSGRGELHLAILIEEMRREGLEFCVSRPEVITTNRKGKLCEPMETLTVNVPQDYQGTVFEKLSGRKGQLVDMHALPAGTVEMHFRVPTRGLIGFRNEFLTDTRGLGIMYSRFDSYGPWCGAINPRKRGSMISMDTGEATAYQLENLQPRGTLFIHPATRVYEGMIIGEHARPGDMICNPTKRKQTTNHRSATKELTSKLNAPDEPTLEKAIEWIEPDELVEITPLSVRLRKAILNENHRRKAAKGVGEALPVS